MISLPDYDSPSALKQFLEERGMAMQKKFGQNFLINSSARKRLTDALDLEPDMKVWEVGPGLGSMTSEILNREADLTVFEIDRGFCSVLPEMFEKKKFNLVCGDVLKTWKTEYQKNGLPQRFFGNLPYNVAAAIITDMISESIRFEKAVVTVQKEVAVRMAAKPGSADYSSFSVLCQWAYDVSTVIDLSGGSFWPKPNVDSRAVKLVKKDEFPRCNNEKHFMQILRAIFTSRRKTIKNNLASFYSDPQLAQKVLEEANIKPELRAETLSIEQILHLSDISYEFRS